MVGLCSRGRFSPRSNKRGLKPATTVKIAMFRIDRLRLWNAVLLSAALALALGPLRPSPQASVESHGWWVLKWWGPSVVLLVPGLLGKWRGRRIVLIIACVVYFVVFMAHPVCELISAATQTDFRTELEKGARRGEPFYRLEGEWYQCKSWLSRQFFF